MLITSQLNHCKGCEDLQSIINDLDCYIAVQVGVLLYNKKYALTKKIDITNLKDAIQIRSILIKRSYNPGYLCDYSILDIINMAKQSTYK